MDEYNTLGCKYCFTERGIKKKIFMSIPKYFAKKRAGNVLRLKQAVYDLIQLSYGLRVLKIVCIN